MSGVVASNIAHKSPLFQVQRAVAWRVAFAATRSMRSRTNSSDLSLVFNKNFHALKKKIVTFFSSFIIISPPPCCKPFIWLRLSL